MSEDTRYNGWTNYETWLVNLWYGGSFDQDALDILNDAEPLCEDGDVKDAAIYDLEGYIKGIIEDQASELVDVSGFFSDILGAALNRVNYREIAEAYIDDIYDEWEKDKEE